MSKRNKIQKLKAQLEEELNRPQPNMEKVQKLKKDMRRRIDKMKQGVIMFNYKKMIQMSVAVLMVFTAFGVVLPLFASENAEGTTFGYRVITSSETWTFENSPYYLNGHIVVSSGVTLTIEPLVNVYFNGTYFIYVEGTLNAIGTSSANILFDNNPCLAAR